MDQFYADLGQGEISAQKVIEILAPEKMAEKPEAGRENIFNKFVTVCINWSTLTSSFQKFFRKSMSPRTAEYEINSEKMNVTISPIFRRRGLW